VKIVMRRLAAMEVRAESAWYNSQRKGLGTEFRKEVRQVLKGIAVFPHRWPICVRTIRKAVLSRFPYVLYYEARAEEIRVFRVVHAKRDPMRIHELLP
jgi:toxin ParE1/3/4